MSTQTINPPDRLAPVEREILLNRIYFNRQVLADREFWPPASWSRISEIKQETAAFVLLLARSGKDSK